MKLSIPIHLIHIEPGGYHMLVEFILAGKPHYLVIDTGASRSVFDIHIFSELFPESETLQQNEKMIGLGTNDHANETANIPMLQIHGHEILNLPIVLADLHNIIDSYRQLELPDIIGIIGSDWLVSWQAILDLNLKVLQVQIH